MKLKMNQVIISPSFGGETGRDLRIVVAVLRAFVVHFKLEILLHYL